MAVKSKKKILGLIKLQIPAGKANPSPPVGPALGQKGLNIMEFCKAFNAATQKMEPGIPVPVVITAYEDKSFTFITKLPPVAYYIKQAAKIKSASKEPGKVVAGQITMAQVKEIAEAKMPDLNCSTVEAAMNMVKGQAVSMGVKVVE
ncbi:MAG: 50S ribosomal protein L11 [Alphaproteobacteria bacterium]|jgi:large subunit ribosomal protein L11|nr:MAG: 50S ribosomal protein L11 [Azospirillum sp. 51_20]